ncbi:MAG: hypothetical protein ISR73_06170 [Gammaproteobacteria bacterium]|nr:hypothetical protein [Gammaproteobacteria bacterium]
MNLLKTSLLASALLAVMMPVAHAACPADGSTPFFAGPIDPNNGFSTYLADSQGLALAPCLNPALCFFDPVFPNNPFSVQIGFGAEGFYFLAGSVLAVGGVTAELTMAAEQAFITPEPEPGAQFPFTRLRMRVDITTPGIYTITHPYGEQVYVLQTAGRRVVNDSFDIEFMPNAVNSTGRVAPWLTWDTFPGDPALTVLGSDYIGINGVPHAIKGSPCGNNIFKISAVQMDGVTPINLDGAGNNTISTDLFSVSGRVFPLTVETPLNVDGVTYSRNATGTTRLNIHATAPITAVVRYDTVIDGVGDLPMAGDGSGRHFASENLGNSNPPTSVEVVATNVAQANAPAVRIAPVHDIVDVVVANYQTATATLDVSAKSSDQFNPPTLTVVGFGDLDALGTLQAINLNVAPATVTIQSSSGGVTVAPVKVINP